MRMHVPVSFPFSLVSVCKKDADVSIEVTPWLHYLLFVFFALVHR